MDDHSTQPTPQDSNAPAEQPRRRLGRGLNSLLSSAVPAAEAPTDITPKPNRLRDVPVGSIDPNPFQPRQEFEPQSLTELAGSLKQHGVLQPLLVRAQGTRFQLIAGERRLRAAQQAGLAMVPCRVVEFDDRQTCEAAIEENLKRRDLNVLEKAEAFQQYLQRFDSTIEKLADQLSLNRSTVSNYLRLLGLPAEVQQALKAERISGGHARALLPLEEADAIALCKQIISENLSVRQVEAAVKALKGDQPQAESDSETAQPLETSGMEAPTDCPDTIPLEAQQDQPPAVTNHIKSLEEQFRNLLGLKVDIRPLAHGAGMVIVHFHSNDEFEQILRKLRRSAA